MVSPYNKYIGMHNVIINSYLFQNNWESEHTIKKCSEPKNLKFLGENLQAVRLLYNPTFKIKRWKQNIF